MKHLGTTALVSNKDGRTPLHEAVMKGHINIVKKFFTYDIFLDRKNIDKEDNQNRTALHWAALGGYNTILDVLIKNGADVEKISRDGKTALHLAINADNDTMKQKLLRAWIGQGGDEGLIRALLDDDKIQVDTKVDDGQPLLFVASEEGHADIVKLLVEKGADIEARDENGQTPLSRAAGGGA
ncbi:uncharacterized protein TrAtP1_000109 [Trichoderma atroviride]|uniref:uncharacterized protein n=1 Tax=Hypocrea atroviridis TaxID=63577 RepID=UPI00332B4BDB|nr:hypothetical protein TrAtP1_000109 [Trichoderma atroviride]